MPGIEKKPEVAGALALCPAPPAQQNGGDLPEPQNNPPQPRQPSNLQGLLRFAVDAHQSGNEPSESMYREMDEERRQFLENALRSMTVDVVDLLKRQIQTLQKVDEIKPEDDISEYEAAIETILEHVDHIDIANDFHKIGGFTIIYPCLKCPHPSIRIGGCELLAVLCQSNPYCQQVVLDNEFIPKLLNMLEKDEDPQVALKALYALSGIVRHSQEGFNQLIHYNGLNIILKSLAQRNDDKFITKATFFLVALCSAQPDLKSRLIFLDYLPLLITLLSRPRQPSHEQILSLLVSLVEDSTTAVHECKNPSHNLKEVLQKYVENVRNKEECLEEEEHCKRLLHILFDS